MAKFIKTENNYRIYELEYQECKEFYKPYPTFVTWKYEETIGDCYATENESGTLEEMIKWCQQN